MMASSVKQNPGINKSPTQTITSVHSNGTIRVQCGNKSERINIRREKLFEKIDDQ
jgi:hypothetical protein